MSEMGQSRRFHDVCNVSGWRVKADTAYPWQVTPKIAARGTSENPIW
jgi:hypothetical protein